jgi:vacuolar-type H+-ATPase subunit E/Vma4
MSATSKFTADILTMAKEKARSIIANADTETERTLQDAEAHLSKETENIVRNAQVEAEGVKQRCMSEARRRVKLKEQQERSKILQEVFDRTRERVMVMMKDESMYLPYLVGLVENGIRELGIADVTIHLNQEDLKRISRTKLEGEVTRKLGRPTKIEWAKDPLDTSGGVVVASSDGRTRIVGTIDQTFEALESRMLIQAAKILFGP